MSHLWAGTFEGEGFDVLGLLAGVLIPPIVIIGIGTFLLVRRYRSTAPDWRLAPALVVMWVAVVALWLFVVDVFLPWVRTTL